MSALTIILCILTLPLTYFMWAALHELAHYKVLRGYQPTAIAKFFIYPHVYDGKFYWARVQWRVPGGLYFVNSYELACVSFAPRWANVAGVMLTPAASWILGGALWGLPLVILLGGSIVDLAVGSIGWSAESDLKRTARGWKISPQSLRIPGLILALSSAVLAAMPYLV